MSRAALLAIVLAAALLALYTVDMESLQPSQYGSGMNLPREERIRLHRSIAKIVAKRIGVAAFADWAVGQAGAESDYGNSNVYAHTNNPFGIKAGSWINDGKDNEWQAGNGNYFRKFPTLEAAYQHLAELLRYPAYRAFFPLLAAGDYAGFADKIAPIYEPGNPNYSQLVLSRIEDAQGVA